MNNRDLKRLIKYLDTFDNREVLQSTDNEKTGRMYVIAESMAGDKVIAKLPLNKFNTKEVLSRMIKKGYIEENNGKYNIIKKNILLYIGWFANVPTHLEQWGLFAIGDDPDNFEYINLDKKKNEKIKTNDKPENQFLKEFFSWFDTYDFNKYLTDIVKDDLKQYCKLCVDIITDEGYQDSVYMSLDKIIHKSIKKELQSMQLINRAGNFYDNDFLTLTFFIKIDCTNDVFDEPFIYELGHYYTFQGHFEEWEYINYESII